MFGRSEDVRKLPLLLFAMLLLGRLEAAGACPTPSRPTDEELFANASTVFLAHIVRTEEIESQVQVPGAAGTHATPALEATFRLVEVLKGEPPSDRKVKAPMPTMCAMSPWVGLDYVIFLNEGDEFIVWALDMGTPLVDRSPRDKEVLEKLRALSRK
jgi:hypothetical protein